MNINEDDILLIIKKSKSNKSPNPTDGIASGADPEILKRRRSSLAVEEKFRFQWFKKAKITLETISFWQNISISIFKFCQFLYTVKACRWDLINIFKISKRSDNERKKNTYAAVNERRKTEISWTLFYSRLFYKAL